MNISWGVLENMARGRAKIPLGCKLEYEFRPSLSWYPDIHTVHEFWKRSNPDKHPVDFWHLDKREQFKWQDEYLQAKYRQFKGRPARDCAWQRFTLTNPKGEQLILQMDSAGHVSQIGKVKVHQTILDEIQNYLELGGLFNPEMMEHDKVRDLIIKCREALDKYQHECIVA